MAYKLISIIAPAYNEGGSLRELFERVQATMVNLGQPFEFILIDDGSTDNTFKVAKELHAQYKNITILRHRRNHGKSMALMQGFDNARGEIAITMDGDMQDLPEMIPRFLNKIAEGYDLVNGWRKQRRDTLSKRFISEIFNWLVRLVIGCQVKDINIGFKAYRREVYKNMELKGDLHRLIPALAYTQGFKVGQVEVVHGERKFGKSKYRLIRHRGLLDLIVLVAAHTTRIRPFHFFTEIGLIFWIMGLIVFGTWFWFSTGFPMPSIGLKLLQQILFFLCIWSFFVGTLLPLFGFVLDIESSYFQDSHWRRRLLGDIIPPEE